MAKIAPLWALALAALAGCGSSPQGSTSSASALSVDNADVRAKLREMALAASTRDGVTSPTSIRAAGALDHQVAEQALSGDIVNDHTLVFAVVVEGGTFVDNNASVPPGAAAPQGHFLTLMADARDFQGLDYGLSDVEPNWSLLGSKIVNIQP
jgi:hypothetical protein